MIYFIYDKNPNPPVCFHFRHGGERGSVFSSFFLRVPLHYLRVPAVAKNVPARRSTGPTSLNIRYTSMIDGTGKETGSSAGDKDRLVDCEVAFVGQGALVLETTTGKTNKVGYLVFAEEPDIAGELAKLRVQGDKKEKT